MQQATPVQQTRTFEATTFYKSKQSLINGIFQILIGAFCLLFNVVALIMAGSGGSGGSGIWGGLLFVVTGSFGIVSAKTKRKCFIVTFMVFCIISAIITAIAFILFISGMALGLSVRCSSSRTSYDYGSEYSSGSGSGSVDCGSLRIMAAIFGFMAFLTFAEVVFALWGSILCCQVTCCGKPHTVVTAGQPYQPVQGGTTQVVFAPPQAGQAYYPVASYPAQQPYSQGPAPPYSSSQPEKAAMV